MRLSELLNRAPDAAPLQIESFWGSSVEWDEDPDEERTNLPWGYHEEIRVGRVVRNHICLTCGDMRSFVSGETLSCLVVGERALSIDVALRCSACEAGAEAWFLVGSHHDLLAASPEMYLQRFSENRRDVASRPGSHAELIDDLLERAQIAFDDGLGAGSMVYLRKVFEMVTVQVASVQGIPLIGKKGGKKTFRDVLKDVDDGHHIIPREFSDNGYALYSELSEVIHAEFDESAALDKFEPCRRLVVGVVMGIRNSQRMSDAVAQLGWSSGEMT